MMESYTYHIEEGDHVQSYTYDQIVFYLNNGRIDLNQEIMSCDNITGETKIIKAKDVLV